MFDDKMMRQDAKNILPAAMFGDKAARLDQSLLHDVQGSLSDMLRSRKSWLKRS